jgi:hypothetical protein
LDLPATICGNWLLASDGLTERDWLQKQKTTSIKEPHLRTGRLKMSNYRAYIVGLDGHFETFHVIGISDRGSPGLDRSRTEKHEDAGKAEHEADATDRNETRTDCYLSLQQGDP